MSIDPSRSVVLSAVLLTGMATPCQLPAEPQWRWENPQPQGNHLKDVWGTASHAVYAVGQTGAILQYDGVTWSQMQSTTTHHLNGVWGASADDVYAVGETLGGSTGSIVLHFDGNIW